VERTIATVALFLSMSGCSLASHEEESWARPQVRSVLVTPGQASIPAGVALQLRATVSGDGAVPQLVAWSLRCVSGCSSPAYVDDIGSVTAAGLGGPVPE
jgi:hypothetical protein